ncbi:M56 family metallopeptidase [Spirosoma litoris]
MESPLLTQWISGQMMNAICWTLIHSLWIGLLTAVLAGGVIFGTPKASARFRYQLLCGCLVTFVGAMSVVFYREVIAHPLAQSNSYTSVSITSNTVPALSANPAPQLVTINASVINQLKGFINRQAGWIFALWLLFFVAKSLKLISGLYNVHRIRHYKNHALGDEWSRKALDFGRALGIQQSIALVQSELVNVPVTIGLLKPMILLPMGLLFQLPPEQIDTILWHELAHIQRRDYAVNLLQSLVETIFFFNPGLLWLSSLIREEREICCDDIVLAHTAQKSNYLEALFAFQTFNTQPAGYAMALGFGKQQLMNRLKRMVSQENKRLSIPEKIVLLSSLLLLSAFAFIPKAKSVLVERTVASKKNDLAQTTEQASARQIYKIATSSPVKAAIPNQDQRIQLPIAPNTTPRDTTRTFTSILFVNNNHDMANREMMVRDDQGNQYHLKIINNQLVALDVNGVSLSESEQANYSELLPQIDRAMAEKSKVKQETVAEFKARAAENQRQQLSQLKQAQASKRNYLQSQTDKATTEKSEKQTPDLSSQSEKLANYKKHITTLPDSSTKLHDWAKKKQRTAPDISYDQERVRGVIAALVQEKVVASPTDVDWFGLTETELIVNGNRQSDALHQKLKAAYGIKPQYGLYYGPVKMHGTGVFLDKRDLKTAYIGNPQTPLTQPKTVSPIWFTRGPSLETIVSNLVDTTLK